MILNNKVKYLSTVNYIDKENEEIIKRINEILDNHQIGDEIDMELDYEFRDFDEKKKKVTNTNT